MTTHAARGRDARAAREPSGLPVHARARHKGARAGARALVRSSRGPRVETAPSARATRADTRGHHTRGHHTRDPPAHTCGERTRAPRARGLRLCGSRMCGPPAGRFRSIGINFHAGRTCGAHTCTHRTRGDRAGRACGACRSRACRSRALRSRGLRACGWPTTRADKSSARARTRDLRIPSPPP